MLYKIKDALEVPFNKMKGELLELGDEDDLLNLMVAVPPIIILCSFVVQLA